MQISLSGWDSQVPTLILFEGGKEQMRLPQSAAVGKSKATMSRVRSPHSTAHCFCVVFVSFILF